MSHLALEEMLRAHYRIVNGVYENPNEWAKVYGANFYELIQESQANGWLSPEETALLSRIRRDFRNPYTHSHDLGINNVFSKPNFLNQLIKITAPQLVESSVEDEARESIKILVTLFPSISCSFWKVE